MPAKFILDFSTTKYYIIISFKKNVWLNIHLELCKNMQNSLITTIKYAEIWKNIFKTIMILKDYWPKSKNVKIKKYLIAQKSTFYILLFTNFTV